MPLIRYPGSKAKLVDAIVSRFPVEMCLPLWMNQAGWEYREPFFGSGAIGIKILKLLPDTCRAWIGDLDYGITAMWQAVKQTPQQLCERIAAFVPSPDRFYQFKQEDGRKDLSPIDIGFRKLALHLMSHSGFGAMAGGPLGGRHQTNPEYPVDCRWAPEHRQREIWELHKLLNRRNVRISTGDFSKMLADCRNAFIYLDPPYVEKGSQLYKYAFTDADHRRLASALLNCRSRGWAVSYDDHALVRELYSGHRIIPVDVRYSVAIEKDVRRKNREILITHELEALTVSA